jgi:hypothetical protein
MLSDRLPLIFRLLLYLIGLCLICSPSIPVSAQRNDTAYYANHRIKYIIAWAPDKKSCEIKAWYDDGNPITNAHCLSNGGGFYPDGDIKIMFRNGKTFQQYKFKEGRLKILSITKINIREKSTRLFKANIFSVYISLNIRR